MIDLNLNSLLRHLQAKKFDARFQEQTNQITIIFKILNDHQFPLFLRIIPESHLLQALLFLPTPLKSSAISDLARFLHLLNKELDLPGFCLDETAHVVFYRLIMPATNNKIDLNLLETYLNVIQKIAETFFPVVAALAQEGITLEEVQKKIKSLHAT